MKTSFLLVTSSLLFSLATAFATPSPVQLENLTHGTNSNWFGNGPLKFDERKVQADIKPLNSAGVRHMRLYLFTEGLAQKDNPALPRPEVLAELSQGIAFAQKQGLAVIVCPFHASPNHRYVMPPASSPEAAHLVSLWGALAKHLANTDPNTVFLEIASEPTYDDPIEWEMLQIRMHKEIRAAAPRHLIIATANAHNQPNDWDQIGALTKLSLLPDDNVVYNFHYFGPMVFTLQDQRTNLGRFHNRLKGIPYPSTPEKVAPLLETITDAKHRDMVAAYGEARWDRDRIRRDLQRAADWASSRGVRLTCNEFGVQRQSAPTEDRLAYLTDVHAALTEFGIGWTLWGDNCGLLQRDDQNKNTRIDAVLAKTLGLVE